MTQEQISLELDRALAAGLIKPEDRDRLDREARASGRSPLRILLERDAISEVTRTALTREIATGGFSFGQTAKPLAGSGGVLAPHTAFPVTDWDRYQWQGVLGQGGMGRVFLAYDPRLMRQVAIKFLREEQPGVVSRLVREARAQARVQHDRVCKVYEVEEIQGRVYIAMQYIDGHSLAEVRDLDLAEKVRLVKEASEGVHAAHDAGLIHRDIKPANIMVERSEAMPCHPYVMDFGLAYARDDDATQTHGVGTPLFMSPEQALGKENLDSRCDVYALGATLYWVLTGSPPVPGTNSLDVLARIPYQEPIKPWQRNAQVPRDLGLILLKCLEKEPGRRYGSALALADDLARFTAGEAVEARGSDTWYQLRKALMRRKVTVAIAVTALLFLSIFLVSSWQMRRTAGLREAYILDFTQQAEEIEALARYTYMMPLHDIRGERKHLADKVAQIEAAMERAGPLATNAGFYALARGLLALDRPAEAQVHLETAWRNGFDDPRVAYALARTLGARYREGVAEVSIIAQPASRRGRLGQLAAEFRDPALSYLARVPRQGSLQPRYLEALVAFYGNRYEPALNALADVHIQTPWLYEAHLLEGDIYGAQAGALIDRGDREEAMALFRRAGQAYERAAKLAPSDPNVYISWANLCGTMVRMALYGGGELETPYRLGLDLLEKARIAAPDRPDIPYYLAYLHSFYAEHLQNSGGDSKAPLDTAIDEANRVLLQDSGHDRIYRLLGHLFNQRAIQAERETRDPRPFVRQAIEAYERVPPPARNAEYYLDLGIAYDLGAVYETAHGLEADEKQQLSMAAFRRAIALNPERPNAYINLGGQLLNRASLERGEKRLSSLEEAIDIFTSALILNHRHMIAFYNLGQSYYQLGVLVTDRGGDPRGYLEGAVACQQRAAEMGADYPHFPQVESIAWYYLARYRWRIGADWEGALSAALASGERALAADANFGHAHAVLGLTHIQWARYNHESGRPADLHLARAMACLKRAEALLPNSILIHENRAVAWHLAGLIALEKGRSPMENVNKGRRALRMALALNPWEAELQFDLAQLETLSALGLVLGGLDPEPVFQEASCLFQAALDQDPDKLSYLLAFAQHLFEHADWLASVGRTAQTVIYRGLDVLIRVRRLHADHSEALALQAGFEWLLARRLDEGPEAASLRSAARAHLKSALALNPALHHRWARLIDVSNEP